MRTYQQILQTGIILLVIALNAWLIGNGIRKEDGWGILLSIGSLVAIGYCIHLFRQLRKSETEEDFENY